MHHLHNILKLLIDSSLQVTYSYWNWKTEFPEEDNDSNFMKKYISYLEMTLVSLFFHGAEQVIEVRFNSSSHVWQ